MNKRPGHVVVTTEVAMCSFCGRPRTLRNEQHQLGLLVRTIVTCETCHRTLSSYIETVNAEPATPEPAADEPGHETEPALPQRPSKAKRAAKQPSQREAKAPASKSRTPKKSG